MRSSSAASCVRARLQRCEQQQQQQQQHVTHRETWFGQAPAPPEMRARHGGCFSSAQSVLGALVARFRPRGMLVSRSRFKPTKLESCFDLQSSDMGT